MTFQEAVKKLFELGLQKYSDSMNPQQAAAFMVDGFVSYYKTADEETKLVCILQDIEDVQRRLNA